MSQSDAKGVDIYSEEGRVVVSITSMRKKGNQVCMEGKLMGSWEAKMYMPPEMVLKMIKLMLNPSFIWFILCLPYILLRGKRSSGAE